MKIKGKIGMIIIMVLFIITPVIIHPIIITPIILTLIIITPIIITPFIRSITEAAQPLKNRNWNVGLKLTYIQVHY